MSAKQKKRPNVLCFITDDTPDSMLGYKQGMTMTPTIDMIRDKGVDFTNFYSTSSVCTPARYSYLTGLNPGHCPAPIFSERVPEGEPYCIHWNTDCTPETPTIGSVLQSGGYRTGYVGKWHTGIYPKKFPGRPYSPDDDPADPDVDRRLKEDYEVLVQHVKDCGFDYAASLSYSNADNRPIEAMHVHNHEWIAKGARDILDQQTSDQPFFLYVAASGIHGPSHIDSIMADLRMTQAGYIDDDLSGIMPPRNTIAERLMRAGFEATHRTVGALMVDDMMKATIEKLKEKGFDENTIILFTTDHGWSYNGKGSCCEGGVHVPCTMMWKGHIESRSTCDSWVRNIDFLPTIADRCGVTLPESLKIDGISRKSQILDDAPDDMEDMYFEMGYSRAIRWRNWKYIVYRFPERLIEDMRSGKVEYAYDLFGKTGGGHRMLINRYPSYWDPDRLHDLDRDPGEQHNLAYDNNYADILTTMKKRLQNHLDRFDYPFDLSEQPFLQSDRFKELTKKTSALNSCKDAVWYMKGAI